MAGSFRQKVLIVDDEGANRTAMTDLLQDRYELIPAGNGEHALEKALQHTPDLILLDVDMPGMSGHDVLKELKNNDETRDIAVLFITALDDIAADDKGLSLGAQDYVTKPFHPGIFRNRVRNTLDVVQQRRLLEELTNLDGLTQVYNRRKFDEALSAEWRRCGRNGAPLSLCLMDVDFFKPYNDNYGHAEGDEVLRTVARVIFDNLKRPGDFVARYGGEEFVMIFPETDTAGAFILADRIRTKVEELAIPHAYSSVSDRVTISGGVASLVPMYPKEENDLINDADALLNKAKENGRNQIMSE